MEADTLKMLEKLLSKLQAVTVLLEAVIIKESKPRESGATGNEYYYNL